MNAAIRGEPSEVYHATDAISHSKLEVFRRRPALYHRKYVLKVVPDADSSAFAIGRATHAAVLEPQSYGALYARRPDGIDRRTKEGKAAWEQFAQANAGKTILDGEDFALVEQMREAVMAHPAASELFRAGEPELVWRKTFATLRVQARTDWFNGNGCALCPRPYVVDLKTVESLDDGAFRNFEKAFVNLGYHRQAGFYLPLLYDCGIACTDFFFVAVEKCEPYGVAVYKVSNAALQRGQEETLRDLTRLKGCIEANRWPNMPEDVQEIDLPAWYKETWL
jgi:hypothetical protein